MYEAMCELACKEAKKVLRAKHLKTLVLAQALV